MSAPHPLDGLSVSETQIARQVVLDLHSDALINFREIFLAEPRKQDLIEFLAIEHSGKKVDEETPRPPRLAKCLYDVILHNRSLEYTESTVDVEKKSSVETAIVDVKQHASLTL